MQGTRRYKYADICSVFTIKVACLSDCQPLHQSKDYKFCIVLTGRMLLAGRCCRYY